MWLLENDTFEQMRAAVEGGVSVGLLEKNDNFAVTAQENDKFKTQGAVAQIPIEGVLTDRSDIFARVFGGGNTIYSDIIRAVATADADPSVTSIDLLINSPGGQATAQWQAVMDVIAGTQKPVRAIASQAASAAYGIASQADEIVATNQMATFGSIGVVASVLTDERLIQVTSTNAPNKRPDARTVEGQAAIRAQIDQVENQFINMVAQGRGKEPDDVRASFGRGGVVLAGEAQKRGMIDGVMAQRKDKNDDEKPFAAVAGHSEGVESMDLATLQNTHPAVFAEAVAVGVNQERERVMAHVTLGEAYGAMDVACTAIKEGKNCGQLEQAQYIAKGANNAGVQSRADGDKQVADAANGAGGEPPVDNQAEPFEAQIAAELESMIDMGATQ